jgi:hypothetical protein
LITVNGYRQHLTENEDSMLSGKNLLLSIISHSMVRINGVASTVDISWANVDGTVRTDRCIKQTDSPRFSSNLMQHISSIRYERIKAENSVELKIEIIYAHLQVHSSNARLNSLLKARHKSRQTFGLHEGAKCGTYLGAC